MILYIFKIVIYNYFKFSKTVFVRVIFENFKLEITG